MITILKLFFVDLVVPLVMEYMKKRDESPEFAAKADVIFSEWSASSTTEERKKALSDLATLIKS